MKQSNKKSKFIDFRISSVKKVLCCFTILCCLSIHVADLNAKSKVLEKSQSSMNIRGSIVDVEGEPLIGATIVVLKSRNIGTRTDVDGNFSLEVPLSGTLRISYVGYVSVDILIDPNRKNYQIVLRENDEALEEVVVVGYGVQKKESVVGAITQVKGDALVNSGISNITNTLSGKLSGVSTIQRSGQPGSDNAEITIRGLSSFVNSSPLVLLDGVERDFSSIDPNEVATISVLKDASATAVFGAKGANGVIIVTTKRGEVGKPKMDISVSYGMQQPINVPKHVNGYTTMSMLNVAKKNDQLFSVLTSQQELEEYRNPSSRINSLRYPDVNWFNELTEPFAPTVNANFNLSGGTKFVKYFASLGYSHQGSLFKGRKEGKLDSRYYYNRINFRTNLDFSLTKSTVLSFNFGGNIGEQNKPKVPVNDQEIWKYIFGSSTTKYPMYYPAWAMEEIPDPDYPGLQEDRLLNNGGDNTGNPYYTLVGGKFTQNTESKLFTDIIFNQGLDFITPGLSLKVKTALSSYYQYNTLSTEYQAASYFLDFSKYDPNNASVNPWLRIDGSNEVYTPNPPYTTVGGIQNNFYYDIYFDASMNYNRTFGKHSVTGLALLNLQEMDKNTEFPYYNAAVVGRVTYDYLKKYLVEFNMGYTGSERFAPGKRFGFFPSAAVGWIVSEENFFKNNVSWIDKLKLRYSDGLVGSDYANNRWLYISDYSKDDKGYIREDPSPNLVAQWEQARKQDIGIELGFLKNSLGFTIDFFKEHRSKMLISVGNSVPMWVGNSFKELNKGEIKKHGFEIEGDYVKKINKNLLLKLNGNFSFNENRIIVQDDAPYALNHKKTAGTAIGSQINGAYLTGNGYYTSVDEMHGTVSPTADIGTLVLGDLKFLDYDVNGQLTSDDLTRMKGSTHPPVSYAFGGGFTWKGFDFSILFQGYAGKYINFDQIYQYEFYKGNYSIHVSSLDYWSPQNPNGNHGALHYTAGTISNVDWTGYGESYNTGGYRGKMLGKSWRKSDFLRLKELYLGYSLRSEKLKKAVSIDAVKFYVTGNNILTFTSLIEGDPENTYLMYGTYPQMRTVKFGMQVVF